MDEIIYKIEGMKLSETPTEVLTEIIQRITQSLKAVAKSKFPEESKDFKIFINDLSHESIGFHLQASSSVAMEGCANFMSQAYASKNPSLLPKRSYDATKHLMEIIKKQGGERLAVYNSAPDPLFEFDQKDDFPEYSPGDKEEIIEEEVTRIGKVYSISGEDQPLVRVHLLDNKQRFQKKVDRVTGVLLGKYIFQWVDVKGRAKRKVNSTEVEEFDILEIVENPHAKEIAKNYFESRLSQSKEDVLEGEEATKFIRSLRWNLA